MRTAEEILVARLSDQLMYLIDAWIRIDMESEKLPAKERLQYMMNFKKVLIDEFVQYKKYEPHYYNIITTQKYGPYNPGAYDRFVKTKDGRIKRERPAGWPKDMPNLSDL